MEALGVGNDLWAWAVVAIALASLGSVYVTGPGSIMDWLDSSIQRTTLFPLFAAWWIVSSWVVIAVAQVCNGRPEEGADGGVAPHVDGQLRGADDRLGASGTEAQLWTGITRSRPAMRSASIPDLSSESRPRRGRVALTDLRGQ